MNTFNSIIEPIEDISTIYNEDHNCTAIINETTKEVCGETESLKIIDEFQKLYETRIQNVDQELVNEFDQVRMKLEISNEWIRNLREQNIMLVQVVEGLEQTACNRVKLLEEKLKESSMLVSESMTNSNYTHKNIHTLSNRINDLEKDEEYMKQKIEFLQSDIRGLLELIRRAVQQNHWNLDGIQFFEIQPSNIPIPTNCTCDQDEVDPKKIQSLKLQIEHLQKKEKKMIAYQSELENKLADLNAKLKSKEDEIKKYNSQFQNFTDHLKKRTNLTDQIGCSSFVTRDQQTFDLMLVTDIVENLFNEKDLQMKKLRRRLRNVESYFTIIIRDSKVHLNNLKTQLNEKCKTIQELKQQVISLQKGSLEKQKIVTADVATKNKIVMSLQKQVAVLQGQFRYANMHIQFIEGIIKHMRKKFKQTMNNKEACTTQKTCVNINASQKETEMLNSPLKQQNQIIPYLLKLKSLMEKEKEDILKLKVELEKIVGKLCCRKDEEFDVNNVMQKLVKTFECLNNMCSEKEEIIAVIKSLQFVDINGQFTLMDIFRICAIEAQVTIENIKDEMNVIVSTFKSRHQKYVDLNKQVLDLHNQLIKDREKISETINKLQLQEEERARHTERISSGKMKLKDIKNELNHAQSRFFVHINEIQNENVISGYTEMCTCNDLLYSAVDEVEEASKSLQVFQIQECNIATELQGLRNQFYKIDSSIKKLQQTTDEALLEHNTVETTLSQKEQKLEKLENEVDMIHLKIKNILETYNSADDQKFDGDITKSQLYTQTLNEILQTKQDLYKLRKKHDELKYKMSQNAPYQECNEKTCLWKSKVTDLEDQIKIMQHEATCNIEANNFLKNSIESMEEELRVAQVKAENYRRSHSIDSMELKKQIIELENTLKSQKEIECGLRQRLSDTEIELKKSKELLHCPTVPELFKTLLCTMKSIKCGLQELKAELKKLICKDSSDFNSSAKSLICLMEKLQKYEDELDDCFQEIDKLKNTLYSKEKLLENKDKIIQIQKDTIMMTQAELKELHQRLQAKIDNQDQIISQYEKEKKELIKQNELQVQTIGHLQNAVVEAKKCIDQMGHKTMNELQEKTETIRSLTIYAEEAQSQYNECFAEAARQDTLLDLQRNEINNLQQKINSSEIDNCLTIIFVHTKYCSILRIIQEQLGTHVNDMQLLKSKVDTLLRSKCCLENKYKNTKKLWQEAEEKLQELKKEASKSKQKIKVVEDKQCQCKIEVADNDCVAKEVSDFDDTLYNNKESSYEHELKSEIDILIRENEDMKKQLQKHKLDFDIIDKELKIERGNDTYTQQILFELQKLRDTVCCLQYENEQLKMELQKETNKTEGLLEKLQFIKENDVKFEKLLTKLEEKQTQINNLSSQITNNETTIKMQAETIEELKKKLSTKNQQIDGYLSELNEAEGEMMILHEKIQSLKSMLNEKSNEMVKLQADNKMLKNDNSILRMENNSFENKSKTDIYQLQMMLNDLQTQLRFTENNYRSVTEDFHKTQEQLTKMTEREANLQECLTDMGKDYCLKLSNMEKENSTLGDYVDKLTDELEVVKKNYSSKSEEHCKLQEICKSYANQLDILQQQIDKERDKVKKLEESNRCIMEQLKVCKEQNCVLIKEKAVVERNHCEIIAELRDTYRSFKELEREYKFKNKSLASISVELTETAISRSELCNKSQYVVSCVRKWMEEQRKYVNVLSSTLKSQQQSLIQLEFDNRHLIEEMKKLRHLNHLLMQKLKKIRKYGRRSVRNVCVECQIFPPNVDLHLPIYSSQKKLLLKKTARRISASGNALLFPTLRYLINKIRRSKLQYNGNCCSAMSINVGSEENRDCGYQSSTSK